ncbi:MAG: hypothetical protein IPP71_07410 [Bacteroidetes bacterium]|nr:hypothetical protein [Bacteroidota bacterium]
MAKYDWGSFGDDLRSLSQTSDGGYIFRWFSRSNISGDKTENNNGGYDYWIVKQTTLAQFNGRIPLEGVGMITLFPLPKLRMEDILWEDIPIPTSPVIKQKTAMVIMIIGS